MLEVVSKAAAKLSGTAASILDAKGRTVHSIGPAASVYAAVEKLKECQVGALFVMTDGKPVGVISERDYARKIILDGRSSKATRVDQIMSSPIVGVASSASLTECLRVISERRIRHLAVWDGGEMIGVISIGDLVSAIILQQEQTIEQLSTLISDPYPG